ncbi:MAG: tetratricopeptide repeat protein [Treponema sp.]|nr:tetratricopeptide repeat protein [Treponema sp.]
MGNEREELLQLWEAGSYTQTFDLSKERLLAKPMDHFLLMVHGFAAYQLAIAQINNFDTLTYIDTGIWSLRKALLSREAPRDGRLQYVLGKAYYYKGVDYADLAIKFLEEARSLSYNAQDIPEYLGLAYAAVHNYQKSVASFTLALYPVEAEVTEDLNTSDLLLLSIAHSYIALNESDAAYPYLLRCVEQSRDSKVVVKARLLLGSILGKGGDNAGAEAQYTAILAESGENAEAHYQLGELFAADGNPTRARAEWRRAVRIDPAHVPARKRLNM